MDQIAFGERIAAGRKKKGLTQQQLAELLGVTNKAVSRWETGDGYPEITLIPPLAAALEVSIDFLMQGNDAGDEKNPERSVWMGLASCAFFLIVWSATMLLAMLPSTCNDPIFILGIFVGLTALCLYFRKITCPFSEPAVGGEKNACSWCTAYKLFLAACFYPLLRNIALLLYLYFVDDKNDYNAQQLTASAVFLVLLILAGLYYGGFYFIPGKSANENVSGPAYHPAYQRGRTIWTVRGALAAMNWAAVLLWSAAACIFSGLQSWSALALVWLGAMLLYFAASRLVLRLAEPGERREGGRNGSALAAAILTYAMRPEIFWVSATGRRVDPLRYMERFGEKTFLHVELHPDGSQYLAAFLVATSIVLVFEVILNRKK